MSSIASHIVGYDSHLPIKHIRLPLKYYGGSIETSVGEMHTSSGFGHSEFIDLSSQKGHFFPLVQAGITKDMKSFRLVPILTDEPASLGMNFQTLEFLLPHPIISKSTFTFHFIPSSSDVEPSIIIDVLDESYLLLTFRIELSDFLVGNSNHRLTLDSYNKWVSISVPYSFELRSSPFFMKSLDACNLVVSMNDGGLLHFQRTHPLSSIDIYNFSDIEPLISFNLIAALLPSTKKVTSSLGGLSGDAIVDIARLNDNEFVTLSVKRSIKVYNLKTHKQTRETQQLARSTEGWITNVPNKYFHSTQSGTSHTLCLLLPMEGVTGPVYEFTNWNVTNGKLEQAENFTLDYDSLNNSNGDSKNLIIQDFQIIDGENELEYIILYKSNVFSEIMRFNQAKNSKNITMISRSLPHQSSVFSELRSNGECKYYLDMVFKSGLFDRRMVASALEIFIRNSKLSPPYNSSMSLREKVTLSMSSTYQSNGAAENSSWYKFTLICMEFRRSSHEALSLAILNDSVISSEMNGVGIYRKPHQSEVTFYGSEEDHITTLVKSVSSKLSARTIKRVIEEAIRLPSIDVTQAEELASQHLIGKLSNDEIAHFMYQMDSLPDIVDVLHEFINMSDTALDICDHDRIPVAGEGIGLLSMLLTIDIFESIKRSHEGLLNNLLVLLLLCEVNDVIVELLNLIVGRLRMYSLMSEIFNISFTTSGSLSPIESSSVNHKENSLFWRIPVREYATLRRLIQSMNYTSAFQYYTNEVLNKNLDFTFLAIMIDLLNRNESVVITKDLDSKINHMSPVNSFLIGIIHLLNSEFDKFRLKLTDYDIFRQVNNDETRALFLNRLNENSFVREFLHDIFVGPSDSVITESNYFHQLAQLVRKVLESAGSRKPFFVLDSSENHRLLELSLELEQCAISILETSTEASTLSHLSALYLRNHFKIAVDARHFQEAAKSLSDIKNITSRVEFKSLATTLLKAMIKFHDYEKLFLPGFFDLFSRNYTLIDSILLELANDDLVLSNALMCYQLLFSWRLLGPKSANSSQTSLVDKRGAAEALYIFITRFQIEQDNLGSDSKQSEDFRQFKLKILELYKIILTTLRTFASKDDQWIRKRGEKKNLNVITLTELSVEYYHWLKDLELV